MVGASRPAENLRADGQVQFIHQPRAEQRVVQFAAALAKQSPHVPFLPQPAECIAEINLLFATYPHHIRQFAELRQFF